MKEDFVAESQNRSREMNWVEYDYRVFTGIFILTEGSANGQKSEYRSISSQFQVSTSGLKW